uniref:Uncharacterized protein n=1 Tax=Trypanosoma vivax (strain Y486) TaxID=1055687 RepID=G0U966_TRYVY|nr:conserved hypothetical protein [Trypanosoma vivax Y486]
MGQLSHWPLEREDAGKLPPSVSLLHITELLLRCCGDGPTFQFVFIGVGSAVCCVFGFPTEVRGTPWGSVKFLDFVREHLVTSKSSVSFDALIEYDNLRNTKQGAANGDQSSSVDHVTNGAKTGREKQRLAIDLALCAAATHPSLTLNQLLREVSQCKFDSSHSASPPEKTGKKLEGGSDLPTFQVICDCLLSCALSFDADRCVSNGPTCTADAARLSLDTVWYAMASHVVVAEMSARRKGRELGCYSLFSLRSSRPSDTAGVASTRRFGVGWFQQLWQGASRTRNSDLVESCEGTGSWTGRCPFSSCCGDDLHVDATQTLRFLSQLNGGPKPLVCDDADTDGGCFHFGAKRRAKSQGLLDPPVFTNQTIVFPISAVGEQYGAMALPTFDAGAEEGFPAVTAFYFVSLEMMKGTTRDAVVQDVVLLEGDKVASEDDVMAVLQKKRTTPDMEPLSACHQLVTYLLEDVWRYNTS